MLYKGLESYYAKKEEEYEILKADTIQSKPVAATLDNPPKQSFCVPMALQAKMILRNSNKNIVYLDAFGSNLSGRPN
ncbi:unnamed protein product [Caretta caretta]